MPNSVTVHTKQSYQKPGGISKVDHAMIITKGSV